VTRFVGYWGWGFGGWRADKRWSLTADLASMVLGYLGTSVAEAPGPPPTSPSGLDVPPYEKEEFSGRGPRKWLRTA
jgi:hypothetical protein